MVWGTGSPRREFPAVDDSADACVFVMKHYSEVVGYKGKIVFDTSRPDGPPQKLLDVSRIKKLGWSPKIGSREGLAQAYADFLATGRRHAV